MRSRFIAENRPCSRVESATTVAGGAEAGAGCTAAAGVAVTTGRGVGAGAAGVAVAAGAAATAVLVGSVSAGDCSTPAIHHCVQNSPSNCSSSPGSTPGSVSGAPGASPVLGRSRICTVAGAEGACASDGGAGAMSVTLTSGDETARASTTPTRLMPASRRLTANASARAPRSAGTRLRPPESAPFPSRRMSGPSTAARRRLSWGCPASRDASPPISVGARGRSYGRDFGRVRGGRPSCQQTGSEVAASGSSALRVSRLPRLAVAGRPTRRGRRAEG